MPSASLPASIPAPLRVLLVEDDPAHAEASRTRGLERSRRFDWQDTARRTIAVYRTVLGR